MGTDDRRDRDTAVRERMPRMRLVLLVVCALLAFAGNSLLCRLALRESGLDAASFTTVRLVSGALTLLLIVRMTARASARAGDWLSAFALFGYAACFSFAYRSLTAATGALLLFGAVQATMIGYGLKAGERFTKSQLAGFVLALGGLASFLLPGVAAPPLAGCVSMLVAGAAWGMYSLRGRGAADPLAVTAGNFARAVPACIALSVVTLPWATFDRAGFCYAIASGALTSGLGYVAWYAALPSLRAIQAASVQLSVPVIAALGGALLLGETPDARLLLGAAVVLGGISLTIAAKRS
jgi:drug/metabolite transporter (DMT)-like permease